MAFYRWKVLDNYTSEVQEENVIDTFKPKQLYVKVMDIDWDDTYGVYPTTTFSLESLYGLLRLPSIERGRDSIKTAVTVTPVIFITVRALQKTADKDIIALAEKIVKKTDQLVRGKTVYSDAGRQTMLDSTVKYNEIQFDCDWNASVQKKYFSLLTAIKKALPEKLITSTLRLHQYKYPKKTGVPPADECYLMCYNTGDLKNINEKNSIFDYNNAKLYFDGAERYPIKLNFALPAFSWVIIYKDDKYYKIDNNMGAAMFADTLIVKHEKDNIYLMQVDTVINNNFLRAGDILKWEKISPGDMQLAAQLCSKAINSDNFKVVFYDIDHVNKTDYEAIHKAFSYFSF